MRVNALDVTNIAVVPLAIRQAHADSEGFEVLINNAGYGPVGPFESATNEQIQQQFAANIFGVFAVTRAAQPLLRVQKSGVIINITSVGGARLSP